MPRLTNGLFIILLAPLLGYSQESTNYPRQNLLIEPSDLSDKLSEFLILDARSSKEYLAGHIPGSIRVEEGEWKKEFQDGGDVGGWERRIGDLGIDGSKPVVVYDDAAGNRAARVWWILRYYGVANVSLLNGFWRGWNADMLPIETEPNQASRVQFKAMVQASRLARKGDLLRFLASDGRPIDIVDARSHAEYCGKVPLLSKRAGHIPSAKHLDWVELVDTKGSHRFGSANELRKLFQVNGVDLKRPIVTHCQSGGRSSVMAFALELMGADQVANYHASWSEWGNADDTPIEANPDVQGPDVDAGE